MKRRKGNQLPIIPIGLTICLLGVITFLFLHFYTINESDNDGLSSPVALTVNPNETPDAFQTPDPNGNNTDPNNNNGETPPDIDYTVRGINLFSNGRLQTEFHVNVGETVMLTSGLIPEGASADVLWSSSDIEVIEVTQTDSSGFEAKIVGVGPGVADIIVSAGGVEENFVVYVDNLSIIMQFENALNDEDLPIWLTISWMNPDIMGQEIVFERDQSNQLWTMESAAERGPVNPTFVNENGIFTIRFPDADNIYFLFDDSTGFYGHHGDPNNEIFIWWFKTEIIEPEG